jgi:hypothetical protein
MICVRFGDDFVARFGHRREAERFLIELRERFAKFGLALHADETRSVAFGRYAERNRRSRDGGKPETFNFLGFTHSCGKTRKGYFTVLRQTMRQRWQAKLRALKDELRQRMHTPIAEQGAYLRSVLLGHFRYYGVPRKRSGAKRFPDGGSTPVACGSEPPKPRPPRAMAPYESFHHTLASASFDLSPLSFRAPRRCRPRWKPDAVIPLVRIYGRGCEPSKPLLRLTL